MIIIFYFCSTFVQLWKNKKNIKFIKTKSKGGRANGQFIYRKPWKVSSIERQMRILSSVGNILKTKIPKYHYIFITGTSFPSFENTQQTFWILFANKWTATFHSSLWSSCPHLDNSTSSSISSSDSSDEESSLGGCHWFFICSAFILFISFSDCCYRNRIYITPFSDCCYRNCIYITPASVFMIMKWFKASE